MGRIGFIGGSGLYELQGLTGKKEVNVTTPFGKPSDTFVTARLAGREVVFLPRHDRDHTRQPSEINYRANIYGMKKLGAEWIISVTACGSLKEHLKPLDFCIPTQFVDRTNQARSHTFFNGGIVAHLGFAHPVCEHLARNIHQAAEKTNVTVHFGGTYLNMEGPQFSTLAESNLYRAWGMDIIGMTNMVEARLAREAEICYATLAAITDYDCWHETAASVTVDMVIANLKHNVRNSQEIIKNVVRNIPQKRTCGCKDALKHAIVTQPKAIKPALKKKLKIIIGKYVP